MFKIQKELLEATLNYLAKQPFGEVAQLINAIQQCKPIEEIKEEKEKPKK